jgi:hypothetical protein
MPWSSDAWKRLVDAAVWIRAEQRIHDPLLTCGVCRNQFIPGIDGAATFTDEHKAIRLTVCPGCEHPLLLRGRTRHTSRSSSDHIDC